MFSNNDRTSSASLYLGSGRTFKHVLKGLLISACGFTAQAVAIDEQNAEYQLAQGCYAIQSVSNNQFLKKFHQGGAVDNGLSYHFEDVSVEQASHFFFKPTSFSNYMLTDKDGRFLASHLPAEASAGRYPGEFAEWKISAESDNNGGNYYRFFGNGLNLELRHNTQDGGLYFFDLLNPTNANSENQFRLIVQNDCKPFPEIEVNSSGDLAGLKGDVDLPVRGFVDPHTHMTSYEFMGGKMMHGKPMHRWGVEYALPDSKEIHGPDGSLDIIGNLYAYGDANYRYDTRGWPDFPFWPNHKQISHMGYYYKWIERAWQGGLRMATTHLVENEVLCNVQKTVNPASWIDPNDCNTMNSIRLQIQRLHEMQDYIDAQSGGPGKGFFRLVTSAEQSRQVIADGKLAVLMGIEASEIFNCGIKDECNRRTVEAQLQEFYDLGVRVMYPTHKFDNKFAGSKVEDGFINLGGVLSTGHFFETKECNEDTRGAPMTSGFPLIGDVPVISDILDSIGYNPEYDESRPHCNKHGLSELGVYLVNRMIDKKMLIELDHMSAETATKVMDIVETRNYSGVITSHSWMNHAKDGGLHVNAKRLAHAGGFMAPYNSNANSLTGTISHYLDTIEQTPFLAGVGLGTDMSGMGGQAGPRSNSAEKPLKYPFTNEFGITFDKQQSGNRVFDFNSDGMAHYGMLADHLQDIREQSPSSVYEAVMNSAEAYLQMWERAEAHTDGQYNNPLKSYVRIQNRASGRCMDIPGNGDDMYDGINVILYDCEKDSWDQKWVYDDQEQTFANKADPEKCLDNRGETYNEGQLVAGNCADNDNVRWTYQGSKLASADAPDVVADAYGTLNDSEVGMWESHGESNQQWMLRPEMSVYRWISLRDKRTGMCLDVSNGDSSDGTPIQLWSCNSTAAQKWYYHPIKGTLISGLDDNKCLDITGGDASDHSQLVIQQCSDSSASQQFDKEGKVYRSRLAPGQVIDAAGEGQGAPVIMYSYHGGDNQKWIGTLH